MNTENLPVVVALKDMIVTLNKELKNFPRFERYSYGKAMIDHCVYLIEDLTKANRSMEKREEYLNQFLSDFEPVNIILQICIESKIISEKGALRIGKQADKVLKQATAWRNKTHKRKVGAQ